MNPILLVILMAGALRRERKLSLLLAELGHAVVENRLVSRSAKTQVPRRYPV